MKPVLSGHRIKRTPSIKRTVVEVLEFISLIYFNETFIKRTPLLHAIKRTRTEMVISIVSNLYRKCKRLPPTNFHFYLKKRDLTNFFD